MIGGNRHQDFAYVGNAMPNSQQWRDAKRLKDAGMHIIRAAHYPQDPAFMDACDELGLFVIVPTPGWQYWNKDPNFATLVHKNTREIIRRDRNHPSVILWSLGNELQHEERPGGLETGDWGVTQYRMMDVLAKHWDPTRPTTVANYPSRAGGIMKRDRRFWEKAWSRAPELARTTEVASFNYRPEDYATYLSFDPDLNIFQSEAQWTAFKTEFNQAYAGLLDRLKMEHPALTAVDQQVIALILLDMDISDICLLLNQTKRTVWSRRQRIKEHLGLTDEEKLDEWLFGRIDR